MWVLGYLVHTKRIGMTFGGRLKIPSGLTAYPDGFANSTGLHTLYDSSWGKQPMPFGGYAVMYNNGCINENSRKVKIVPDSNLNFVERGFPQHPQPRMRSRDSARFVSLQGDRRHENGSGRHSATGDRSYCTPMVTIKQLGM
jgi:hypothetical protein|eukprot:7391934-Prymnesium_polylepis.3